MKNLNLTPLYVTRLGLSSTLDLSMPTFHNLCHLQEAHLVKIPFENTSQHGVGVHLPSLDVQMTATKILKEQRGGFCFELNGLLSYWLEEMGYQVTRVPATVLFEDGTTKSVQPTHLVLIVECEPGTAQSSFHFVDVGFGEPSLHPLRYEESFFTQIQVTPEGMKSQLIRDGDMVQLYWEKDGRMLPRLQWSYEASQQKPGPSLSEFQDGLQIVLQNDSVFSQKLIVTKLTRERKYTLAGSRYQVTGPPRFIEEGLPEKVIQHLDSEEDAQEILEQVFGIPKTSSAGLTFGKSNAAPSEIWTDQ